MTSGKKLILAGLVVAATTAYMAYLGAAESWQYYLTCDECVANIDAFVGNRLRVSGTVADGTMKLAQGSRQLTFALQGVDGDLPVLYTGAVPDNMAEGIEVVVEGRLDSNGTLRAEKLLTKCASKYASKTSDLPPSSEPQGKQGGVP